jgi:pyruvate/2-oxoglutarate dehydrogenase complex dihydrolipoamide dehydrogenase (E3) component
LYGSRAKIDDIPGLRGANPLTHIEIWELDEVPSKLLILGGGYIGLEFAQAMRRLGAAVTVIDRNKRLLKNEDEDIANMLVEVLQNEGVMVSTSTMITEVSGKSGSSVTLKGTMSGEPVELTGSHMLCATARLPNTQNIGLENVGVKVTDKGFVKTDENLHTSSEGIFAVGDCAGSPYFTHVAFDDFRISQRLSSGKAETHKQSFRSPSSLYSLHAPRTCLCRPPRTRSNQPRLKFRTAKLPMAGFLKTRTLGRNNTLCKDPD